MNKNEVIERIEATKENLAEAKKNFNAILKIYKALNEYNLTYANGVSTEDVRHACDVAKADVDMYTRNLKQLKKALNLAEQYEALIA